MSEHGSGIPLGHYKSKSVSRINFLEKCERSQREFITTVEGVVNFHDLLPVISPCEPRSVYFDDGWQLFIVRYGFFFLFYL